MKVKNRQDAQKRRHLRIGNRVRGTAERPRMCVKITNRHIHVQFIDDRAAATLAAASTTQAGNKVEKLNVAAAVAIGRKASEAARSKGIAAAVFDRGGHVYHGRVRAIAEAARAAGIKL
ncbi:MAG: 50S ribosomal protein L18 [Lentisphaerae bacterium]|nr:50S ribosomal protein L18 [Lentisphaerota bacterium]